MLTSEEQYRDALNQFYKAYNQLKNTMNVRMHTHQDLNGNNTIKIYEYDGEIPKRLVMKAAEENDTDLYLRAAELIVGLLNGKK